MIADGYLEVAYFNSITVVGSNGNAGQVFSDISGVIVICNKEFIDIVIGNSGIES
jgi:hypothetical protein